MLRGQGTLQELLGGSVSRKKRKAAPETEAVRSPKQLKRKYTVTPAAANPCDDQGGPSSLDTDVVGIRHQHQADQTGTPDFSSTSIRLAREPGNPADPNAVLVLGVSSSTQETRLGHVPAEIAAHLATVLDSNTITPQVTVLSAVVDSDSGACQQLRIRIAFQPALRDEGPKLAMDRAVAAAEARGNRTAGQSLCNSFDEMAHLVGQYDSLLLDEEELQLLSTMQALPGPCKVLLLRLLLRKPSWFHLKALSYADVPDTAAAVEQLHAAGLVGFWGDPDSDLSGLLQQCSAQVLRQVVQQLLPPLHPARQAVRNKAELLQVCQGLLQQGVATRSSVCRALQQHVGQSFQLLPAVAQTFTRVERVFFTVEGQGLSMFSAVGSGAVRYPDYKCERSFPVWQDREELLAYERALADAAVLEAALEGEDLAAAEAALQPSFSALTEGLHKQLVWSQHAAVMPNPPPASSPSAAAAAACHYLQLRPTAGGSLSALIDSSSGDHCCCSQSSRASPTCSNPSCYEAPHTQDSKAADVPGSQPRRRPAAPRPLFLARFTAAWVYADMATVGVSLLERQQRYTEAVELLQLLLGGNACVGRRGEWWQRLAVNLEHLGKVEDALEVAEAALADAWVRHGGRLGLQRRVLRLGRPPRRWKKPSWAAAALVEPAVVTLVGRPLGKEAGKKSRFYSQAGSQVSVEQLALEHYCSEEGGAWKGMHTEGGIWSALFTLIMWEVIFSGGIPGVFRTPFQTRPLDLGTDAFYSSRKDAVDGVLQEVANGGAGALVQQRWSEHHGKLCQGVNWAAYQLTDLLEVLECVGGLGLSVLFRLMAEDVAGHRGGLPDLVLWHTGRKAAQLVEVKGPRDRLSDQQLAWLHALAAGGLSVHVCKIIEP